MAIVVLVLGPFLSVGESMQTAVIMGAAEMTSEISKSAELLCSDAITNYKTVQSLGNEEFIV